MGDGARGEAVHEVAWRRVSDVGRDVETLASGSASDGAANRVHGRHQRSGFGILVHDVDVRPRHLRQQRDDVRLAVARGLDDGGLHGRPLLVLVPLGGRRAIR